MRPTLDAAQLRSRLIQYFTTTCALTGEDTRRVLERCLEHAGTGMLRGPFLRIRTPFHKAEASWEKLRERVSGFAHAHCVLRARPGARWSVRASRSIRQQWEPSETSDPVNLTHMKQLNGHSHRSAATHRGRSPHWLVSSGPPDLQNPATLR